MKISIISGLLLALLPAITAAQSLSLTLSQSQSHFTFCYDPFPPYTFGKSGSPTGGLKVKLLDAIFNEINGATAEVILLPWKQCQRQTEQGRMDGILPLFKNDERRSYMVFSDSVFDQVSTFWYKRSKFPDGVPWETIADISHLKLGMLTGSYIDEDMETAFEEQQGIHRGKDVLNLFNLLLKDRIDLVAIDEVVGRYVRQQNKWQSDISMAEKTIGAKESYFGISQKSDARSYLDEINAAILVLKENGIIEEIRTDTNY